MSIGLRMAHRLLCLGLVLVAGSGGALPAAAASAAVPNFSHVFLIVMENQEASGVLANPSAPYINQLANQYAAATEFYGVTHPSLPNYLALIGGDTFGIRRNCTRCFLDRPTVVDQIEASGRTWRTYQESMPRACFVGDAEPYVQRHNPFIYFDAIRSNPDRCSAGIVSFDQFWSDLSDGRVPNYVFITPDTCHDMHGCETDDPDPLQTGDTWLSQVVPAILNSAAYQDNGILFLTWDEGETEKGCCGGADGGQIMTLVISPRARPGYRSSQPMTHYSVLRTIEEAWGLPLLGQAATAPSMADFFTDAPAEPAQS
jgi:phosphatidylinositol-3-phosphatase